MSISGPIWLFPVPRKKRPVVDFVRDPESGVGGLLRWFLMSCASAVWPSDLDGGGCRPCHFPFVQEPRCSIWSADDWSVVLELHAHYLTLTLTS